MAARMKALPPPVVRFAPGSRVSLAQMWGRGPRGLPGVNAVPADEAIGTYLEAEESESRAGARAAVAADVATPGNPIHDALTDTIATGAEDVVKEEAKPGGAVVGQIRSIRGGITPATLRVPTLGVDEVLPRRGMEHITLVWAETGPGEKRYGVGRDGCLYTMTASTPLSAGTYWTRKGNPVAQNTRLADQGAFIKLKHATHAGVLLAVTRAGTTRKLVRSTDDGETWTEVYTFATNHAPIGPTVIAEDKTTGYVYLAPYNGNNPETMTEHALPRSTDGGATWSSFTTLPGQAGSADASIKVRHVHGVQWDPVGQRIFYMVGDGDGGAGIYRVNAAGTGVEKVVTNHDLVADPETGHQRACAINVAFFPDHIVWITDLGGTGMWALPRTKFGAATGADVELLYRPSSTGWFTVRASDDNTKWCLSASNETHASAWSPIDRGTHLYSVERADGKWYVWEVATEKTAATTVWSALASVGSPEMHGDDFWIRRHGYSDRSPGQWRCRLLYGAGVTLPQPEPFPVVAAWTTVSSGIVSLSAMEEVIFGQYIVPKVTSDNQSWRQDMFRIFNMGVYPVSGAPGGGIGRARLQVYNHTRPEVGLLFETTVGDYRAGDGSSAPFIFEQQVIPGDILRFKLVEDFNNPVDVNAFVTYGTGERGIGPL